MAGKARSGRETTGEKPEIGGGSRDAAKALTKAWQIGIRTGIILAVVQVLLSLPDLHPAFERTALAFGLSVLSLFVAISLLYYAGYRAVASAGREGGIGLGALGGAVAGGVAGLLTALPNHYIFEAVGLHGRSPALLVTVLSMVGAVIFWTAIGLLIGLLGGWGKRHLG